ncbi:MAG: HEAT repeat domain-containing protein [Planctomycetes bacterium]|nr:HEAT repeat domain-containing protein [Planctomycetota bacterium]
MKTACYRLFSIMVLFSISLSSCSSFSVETDHQILEIDKKIEEIRKIIIEREKSNQYWFGDYTRKEIEKKLAILDIIASAKDSVATNKLIAILKNDSHPHIKALAGLILGDIKENPIVTPSLIEALKQDNDPVVKINLLHALKISTNIDADKLIYSKWYSRLVSIAEDEGVTLLYDAPPIWSLGRNPFLLTFHRSKVTNDYYQNQIDTRIQDNIQQVLTDIQLSDEDVMVRNVAEKFLLKYSSSATLPPEK